MRELEYKEYLQRWQDAYDNGVLPSIKDAPLFHREDCRDFDLSTFDNKVESFKQCWYDQFLKYKDRKNEDTNLACFGCMSSPDLDRCVVRFIKHDAMKGCFAGNVWSARLSRDEETRTYFNYDSEYGMDIEGTHYRVYVHNNDDCYACVGFKEEQEAREMFEFINEYVFEDLQELHSLGYGGYE